MSVATSAVARRDTRYRVLLVDDSAAVRGLFRKVLAGDPEIEIVGSVGDGARAIEVVRRESIDVAVLDIDMPGMDGLTALPRLLEVDPSLRVIMASTLTQRNAAASLQALAAGAADYIPKPSTYGEIFSAADFQRELVAKVKALGDAHRRAGARAEAARSPVARIARSGQDGVAKAPRPREPVRLREPSVHGPRVVCIGSSTGGPRALMTVTGALKHEFDLPILITQHMPKTFTGVLADHLRRTTGKPCAEGVDGEPIAAGRLYVAPGARHMEIVADGGAARIRLSDAPPVNFCKPAVDPMLQSAVAAFGGRVLAVILTGMGQDGLVGGRAVVEGGGTVIAQDEATSVVWGMPRAVAGEGLCAAVLPVEAIAGEVRRLAGRTVQ